MKRKVKLSFEALEKELDAISAKNTFNILGGFGNDDYLTDYERVLNGTYDYVSGATYTNYGTHILVTYSNGRQESFIAPVTVAITTPYEEPTTTPHPGTTTPYDTPITTPHPGNGSGGGGGDYGGGSGGGSGGGGLGNGGGSQNDPIRNYFKAIIYDSDISENFKNNLQNSINKLETTITGAKLLSYLKTMNMNLNVTNNGDHSAQNNTLNIGIFDENEGNFTPGYHQHVLGHELLHIIQYGAYGGLQQEIKHEVEANILQYRIAKEILNSDDLNDYMRRYETNYGNAISSYAEGTMNTVQAFNNLIDGFKTGVNAGTTYNNFNTTHIMSNNDIIIDDLLK